MENNLRFVRHSYSNKIIVKGHLDGLAGQQQGTILYNCGMQVVFGDIEAALGVKMTDFFDGNELAVKWEDEGDGNFKITIDDPKGITCLRNEENRTLNMEE